MSPSRPARRVTVTPSSPYQFSLGLATLTTSTLRIEPYGARENGQATEITVPTGYTLYRSQPITVPAVISLSATAAPGMLAKEGVYVRWAHLDRYVQTSEQVAGLSGE